MWNKYKVEKTQNISVVILNINELPAHLKCKECWTGLFIKYQNIWVWF